MVLRKYLPCTYTQDKKTAHETTQTAVKAEQRKIKEKEREESGCTEGRDGGYESHHDGQVERAAQQVRPHVGGATARTAAAQEQSQLAQRVAWEGDFGQAEGNLCKGGGEH